MPLAGSEENDALTEHHAHQEKQGFFQRYKGIIILLAVILFVSFFCGFLPFGLPQILTSVGIPAVIRPDIQLPGEALTPTLFTLFGEEVKLTNTFVAVILAYIVLLIAAIVARLGLREVPSGFSHLFELLIEFLYNLSEQVVGAKFARRIFPIAATIFIFLLIANWMHFIPGYDSIGILEHPHVGAGYEVGSWNGILYMKPNPVGAESKPVEEAHPAQPAPEGEASAAEPESACGLGDRCTVVPFARAAATDINVPLGLAVISFVTIQVFGAMSLRWGYLGKFINTNGLARGGMGIMDFGVGLFELILEPVKIISLTFRLLGNIFGGGILLVVVTSLIPFLVPVGLYMFELFVGAIQAYVFAMLTLVFSAMAMAGHGGDH